MIKTRMRCAARSAAYIAHSIGPQGHEKKLPYLWSLSFFLRFFKKDILGE